MRGDTREEVDSRQLKVERQEERFRHKACGLRLDAIAIVATSGRSEPRPTSLKFGWLVLDVEVGVGFFQVRKFGQVVVDDVGLARVRLEVVLVIFLGAIKRGEWRDLRHDF